MLGRMLLPAILWIVLAPSFSLAQLADSSTYVRQVHQQYLGREPTAYELQYWIDQLNRGMQPRDVQAFVISSEASFERYQRNVNAWIMASLAQVIRRSPKPDESSYWTDRFRVLKQNRLDWAKELVRWANVGTSSSAADNSWTQVTQGAPAADLPGRLVATSQLLSQTVSTEVTGSSRWLIQLQANNLLSTATTSRDLLSKPGANAADAATAVGYLEQALETLRGSLNQLGYTTPSSQHYVMQASDILVELKKMFPGGGQATLRLPLPPTDTPRPNSPVTPLAPVSPVAPVSAQAPAVQPSGDISRSIADLQQSCRQLVLLVRTRNSREPLYDRLLRDVESLSASVGLFRSNLQFGYALDEQRKHVRELQRQAATVTRDLRTVAFDAQMTQMWHDTTYALDVVAADVGLTQAADVSRAQCAVPVNRPTFNGLPLNLPPPPAATSISSEAIQTLDQAISQCDALTTTLGLYGYYTPGVAQLIGELRAERNELTDLRRQALQVPVPSLAGSLRLVNDQHQRVTTRWNEATAAGQLRSAPSLYELNAAIGRVNQALGWLP